MTSQHSHPTLFQSYALPDADVGHGRKRRSSKIHPHSIYISPNEPRPLLNIHLYEAVLPIFKEVKRDRVISSYQIDGAPKLQRGETTECRKIGRTYAVRKLYSMYGRPYYPEHSIDTRWRQCSR